MVTNGTTTLSGFQRNKSVYGSDFNLFRSSNDTTIM